MRASALFSLVRKEVRHLLPLMVALFGLEVIGLFHWVVNQSPDTISWAQLSFMFNPSDGYATAVICLVVGVVSSYLLLPHEQDNRSLLFLWALPVRRWQIYVIKLLVAIGVNLLLVIFGHLLAVALHSFNPNSITVTQFGWPLWRTEVLLLGGTILIGIGYGALIAYYRVGGILVGLLVFALISLLANFYPGLDFLRPVNLLIPEFTATEYTISLKTWWAHGLGALLAATAAGFLWVLRGGDEAKSGGSLARWLTYGSVSCVLVLLVFSGFNRLSNSDSSGLSVERKSLATADFEFVYFEFDEEAANALAQDADQLGLLVQAILNIVPTDPILADLTEQGGDHLGIAGWNKLRVRRDTLTDLAVRDHVFVHEVAHVLAARAADRRLSQRAEVTAFFNEGLAEWVSYEVLPGLASERESLRLLAALAWQRFDLRFEDFLYSGSFRAVYDENLIYALGEAWVSVFAQTCGATAPGELLRAFGRPNVARIDNGPLFWQDAMQAIGCDLGTINARLGLLLQTEREELRSVPVPSGSVRQTNDGLLLTVQLNGGDPDRFYDVVVRSRDNPSTPRAGTYTRRGRVIADGTEEILLPAASASGDKFQYQIGIEFIPGERPFFNRWVDHSLAR